MRRRAILVGWLLGFGALTAPSPAAAAHRLKVVASFLPVYCFAANVAGDLADVEALLPAGVAPHDYQLSPRDLRRLAAADLIVVNGLGMENWLDKVLSASGGQKPRTILEAAAGLKAGLIYETNAANAESGAGSHRFPRSHSASVNPHFWLDPRLAAHAVTNILLALQRADPANAAGYARQAAGYVGRLDMLDTELRRVLTPFGHRGFVTLHNAFPYFVRRYDLHLIGVIEEVPEVQPSAKHVAALLRRMREQQARAIFTEPQSSSPLAGQLARDLGLPVVALDPLESGPLTLAAYEEGMRRNAETLRNLLK